jgi:uroporphyrinogen decarboxylase
MNHRDRAMAAINLQEPDRVPLDLGGVAGLIVDPVYFKVCELLGFKERIEPYRIGATANYYDERLLDAFDVDFRHVWLFSPDKPKTVRNPDGTATDYWGITFTPEGSYPAFFPLKDLSDQEVINYKWPDPKNWDTTALKEKARYYYEETDYAVIAKSVMDSTGLFERCYFLRGMDVFLADLVINEDIARFIIEKIAEIEMQLWDMYLDAVGPYVQIIQRVSDFGTQAGMLISPKMYREFFKPVEDKVYRFIKSKAPHVKIWYHSCGAIKPLINDFIDLGVDILNPVQPHCVDMDSAELKREFGKKLCFHGAFDIQYALRGSKEDVIAETRRRIKDLAPGGGYVFAPSNHIQKDVPPENILTMYEYAKKLGAYPIKQL